MLLRNLAWIFTGEGFARRDGRAVRAEDCGFLPGPIDLAADQATGTIAAIGASLSADGTVIDCRGLMALPGFIDPHTHAVFAGQRAGEFFLRWAGKTYVEIAQAGGGIHSTVSVTSAQDDAVLIRDLRDRVSRMLRCGTTVAEVKSGYAADAAGELRLLRVIARASDGLSAEIRPTFLGLHALPRGRQEAEYVDEMIGALEIVARERLAFQVDSFPEKGFFSLGSAVRFSEAARKFGLACKVHADELSDLGTSAAFIRAGALSIDHLQHISDEAVGLLANHGTVATLLPATSFFAGIPYARARRLIDAGARVALATDFNPGTAPAWDLQLTHMLAASQLRMTAAEILCASTYNAAAALGLQATHGVIAPGRAANLLLYDTQPLEQVIVERAMPRRVIVRAALVE